MRHDLLEALLEPILVGVLGEYASVEIVRSNTTTSVFWRMDPH